MCEQCQGCKVRVKAVKLTDEQLKAIWSAGDLSVLDEVFGAQEPEAVYEKVRFEEDYDLVAEAARAKGMPVSEFIAFAAAEYADLYLNAYDAACQDLAEKIKVGRHE
ncbi:hypothetical protein CRG49_008695 [Neisseria sp. N95_16]|uniref:Uncharacterized protein n=1 Tax=Neisseria brasiliensis TaxID=2666100 RepID=A0A7X2GX13_9NEIS|nr:MULTISPECIES: hypothetical protein [Neisseria]MRN37224.1 hypothetical protein [Neisseria brasiliensis]PJO09225.1 hypothetical protein CRG49_008695 [Neisseria sp. N95_16]